MSRIGRLRWWWSLPALAVASFGCSEEGPSRTYALAASGTQLIVTGPNAGFQLTEANLASDVDVIAVHQEYYGVPWTQFAAGTDPPPEWSATMSALASSARTTQKQVFLSVSPLNGRRDGLAARTVISGGLIVAEDGWAARCYDFAAAYDAAEWRTAYLRYVGWMVDLFQPKYLNIAIELNLFLVTCPASWEGMVDVVNAEIGRAHV